VLFLTSSYPKHAEEPSGIFLHYLNKELATLGWSILVMAPNFPGGKAAEVMDGIRVVRFGYFFPRWQRLCYGSGIIPNLKESPWLWAEVPFYLASMFWHASRVFERCHIDILGAHWILPQGVVAALLKCFFRVPLVVTAHGSDMSSFDGALGTRVKRFVLGKAESASANSQYTCQQIQSLMPQVPTEVIPMGVDLRHFCLVKDETTRQELQIQGEFLLFVGRLVEEKGPLYVLKAMPRVLKVFPQAVLVLVGGGTQRAELERAMQVLGITRSVRFVGRIPHQELSRYYSAADVFVGPSLVEGLGIVFLEAAASGLAIVGSQVGGVSDILIDGVTGIEVEPANSEQLANAIIRVLSDAELRTSLAKGARRHVEEHFTWKQIALRFDALLRETLRRKAEKA
jgi:glycosyltransferase involved in cell wall biosynthesis